MAAKGSHVDFMFLSPHPVVGSATETRLEHVYVYVIGASTSKVQYI